MMTTGVSSVSPARQPGFPGSGEGLRRRPLGFRALLGGAFLAVGLLAAGVAAVAVGAGAVGRLREEAGADLAGAAAQVAELLDRGMFERWRDLQVAASLDTIRDPAASRDAKRAVLQRLEQTYPDYAVVLLIGADGRISATSKGSFEGLDVAGRDYFIGGRIGPYAGDVRDAVLLAARLPNRPSGEPPRFLDVAAPIRTPAGEPAGVVVAHLLWDWAEGVQRSVLDRVAARRPGAEAFIAASDGTVLLGPKPWRGRKLPALPGPGDATVATASVGHGSGPWPSGAGGRYGGDFVAGWAPTRGHLGYPGLGWRVVVRQPAEAALAPAATVRREVLLWGAAAAALAAALGWALAGMLARPLAALADAAETLRRDGGGAGAIEAAASVGARGGSDELCRETGSIAASLGGLLAQLRRAAREREAARAEVAAGEARLARALDAARAGTWDWDAATGAQHVSPGFGALFGRASGAVRGTDDLVACAHPDDRGAVSASFRGLMGGAGEGGASAIEFRVALRDGGVRWLRLQGATRRGADGSVLGAGGVVMDVTARRTAEERQALLMAEVDHRAKNALAVVQAVLRLTRADDPKAFARAVEGRVAALARTHTLLSKDHWAGADLRAILAEELAAYRPAGAPTASGERVTLDGPPVLLAPGAAQPLAMALHELATNAAKYGALSTPNGRVQVSWRLDPATGALKLRWTERGGPPVAGPPARRSFGSRVVEETLRRQLGGDERRTWAPEGLVCDLEVPADKLAPTKGAGGDPAAPDPPSAPPVRRRHAVAPTTAAG